MPRRDGNRFIYFVLDWTKPDRALVTAVGTVTLAFIVHTVLFAIQKLRVFVHDRCGGKNVPGALVASPSKKSASTAAAAKLPGTPTTPPTHISMVLGSGYSNEGYVKGAGTNVV